MKTDIAEFIFGILVFSGIGYWVGGVDGSIIGLILGVIGAISHNSKHGKTKSKQRPKQKPKPIKRRKTFFDHIVLIFLFIVQAIVIFTLSFAAFVAIIKPSPGSEALGIFIGSFIASLIGSGLINHARSKKKFQNSDYDKTHSTNPLQAHSEEIKPSPVYSPRSDSEFVELPGALDHIRFRYLTKDKRQGVYTVAVMRLDEDKFIGYCFERRAERSFFASSILDNEVIRVTTGEVLTPSQWLDEQGYSPVELDDDMEEASAYEDIHDFIEFAEEFFESKSISVKNSINSNSGLGRIEFYRKTGPTSTENTPIIYLESRRKARKYLVAGQCNEMSFRSLDDAANYLEEELDELEEIES